METENSKGQSGVAAGEAAATVKAPHVVAVEVAMELLETTPLTMHQRLKFDLARVATMAFPAERQQLAAARIKEYQMVGTECIRQYSIDGFDRERSAFWQKIQELSRPPVQPTERERIGLALSKLWTVRGGAPEIDALFMALKPGETVKSFDWEKAVVAGPAGERILTRRALRLRDRPSYSTVSEEDWINRSAPIRPPEASASK